MNAAQDNRKFPRIDKEVLVNVSKKDAQDIPMSEQAMTKNISVGGAFIETDLALQEGDSVELILKIPETGQSISVEGIVRWMSSDGIPGVGVEYMDVQMDKNPFTLLID